MATGHAIIDVQVEHIVTLMEMIGLDDETSHRMFDQTFAKLLDAALKNGIELDRSFFVGMCAGIGLVVETDLSMMREDEKTKGDDERKGYDDANLRIILTFCAGILIRASNEVERMTK